MTKKPKIIRTKCPFCDYSGKLELKKHDINGERPESGWWYYECPECGESFTTTESDNISLEQQASQKIKAMTDVSEIDLQEPYTI